jgi:prolipoprotein diacylglyceryl transferase
VLSLLASIPPPPFGGLELGPLNVRMYGLLIAIGAFLALQLTVKRYERFGGDPDMAEKAALLALLFGFLGARIGYVIPRYDRFLEDPLSALAIWEGGLTFFGGLFGGAAAVIIYTRRKGGSVPAMADAVAPALPLAQAIGRWGNYFNQELYGRPTDLPWALQVEPPFRRPGYEQFATFHPTFLYESLWNVGLVGVLLWLDRRGTLRRGSLMFVYLIGYGVGRAWIEALRVDTFERYLGLSRNNWIAIAIVLVGVAGLVWWERRGSASDASTDDPSATTSSRDDGTAHADDATATGAVPADGPTSSSDPAAPSDGGSTARDRAAPEDGPEGTSVRD